MQYVPGGNRKRHVTSLRLMKALDRPTDRVYLKKSVSNGFGKESGSLKKYIANPEIQKSEILEAFLNMCPGAKFMKYFLQFIHYKFNYLLSRCQDLHLEVLFFLFASRKQSQYTNYHHRHHPDPLHEFEIEDSSQMCQENCDILRLTHQESNFLYITTINTIIKYSRTCFEMKYQYE